MDRMVKADIAGEERLLNFSIAVMFDMDDRYGDLNGALTALSDPGKKGFEAVRWFVVKMANDAELYRREQGYAPVPLLEEKDISIRMTPLAYTEMKNAVIEAITAGYQKETSPSGEIDLGLEEIEAKKEKAGA